MISQHIPSFKKNLLMIFLLLTSALAASAKGGGEAPVPSAMDNPVVITLVVIMLILLLAIILLAFVLSGAMDIYREKMKADNKPAVSKEIVTGTALLLLFVSPAMAQAPVAESASQTVVMLEGVTNTAFYFMISVIGLELLILFAMLYNLRVLLGFDKHKEAVAKDVKVKKTPLADMWRRLNRFKPAEQEADLMLDHDYDGIRELDNRLPPWWLYGFYLCIVIGVIYMWRFHVSHTAPSSFEEYQYAMQVGEEQKLAYLKNAASNVDENTVIYLGDEASLAAGKNVFVTTCSACHGKAGEGGVGPNLTDEYWLHGGGIKDVFKTIKYGWPDKGMRSWQDDYSPRQLAQIASYVKSMRGTKPANPKEKQGEFYKEETAVPDSTKAPALVTQK